MIHLETFYSLPELHNTNPTKLYSFSVLLLLPLSFLFKTDSIGFQDGLITKPIIQIKPLDPTTSTREKVITTLITLLLLIPSFIFGTCFRALSYLENEVRNYHKRIVEFKLSSQHAQNLKGVNP